MIVSGILLAALAAGRQLKTGSVAQRVQIPLLVAVSDCLFWLSELFMILRSIIKLQGGVQTSAKLLFRN